MQYALTNRPVADQQARILYPPKCDLQGWATPPIRKQRTVPYLRYFQDKRLKLGQCYRWEAPRQETLQYDTLQHGLYNKVLSNKLNGNF